MYTTRAKRVLVKNYLSLLMPPLIYLHSLLRSPNQPSHYYQVFKLSQAFQTETRVHEPSSSLFNPFAYINLQFQKGVFQINPKTKLQSFQFFLILHSLTREMQSNPEKQNKESLQLPPKGSICGHKSSEGATYLGMSHRFRPACTCSNRPGSVRCAHHGYVVPGERLKKRVASKEILRRALTPPPRRLGLRWLNFKPTPSRLSNMSMA